jgi:hypothetical protein
MAGIRMPETFFDAECLSLFAWEWPEKLTPCAAGKAPRPPAAPASSPGPQHLRQPPSGLRRVDDTGCLGA